MSKEKLIEIVDGIRVTKPWNKSMYDHNDKVAYEMKENILYEINAAYKDEEIGILRELGKHVCAYGFSADYDIDELHEEICRELDIVQNYWLNEVYPDMVKDGLVIPIKNNFVGYSKK